MDEFEELKISFLDETTELLEATEQCYLNLEANPNDQNLLEQIFRLAHNIKGSSRALGFIDLADFTHEFESLLIKMKKKQIPTSPAIVSLLLRCNDQVVKAIAALKIDPNSKMNYSSVMSEILKLTQPEKQAEANPSPLAPPVDRDVYLPEEASNTPLQPQVAVQAAAAPIQVDESIRISLSKLEKLLNFVGEMVILQTVLREQAYAENPTVLRRVVHQQGKVTKEIQDISMSLRMVSIKQTFQKMQRIVRDTSASLDKKVMLTLEGEETEVDKTILENLSDPLVHLIRNAVDHGIESREDRMISGKSETGTIFLRAYHEGGSLVIEVRDDGAGLNANKLVARAKEKGILANDATLSQQEAYQLIFHPGFSTKVEVTNISGRGVGMDVVKTNIEKLQGEIQILTEVGRGTCFKVRLPLTLAIIDGMIVQIGDERYVIPLSHVYESIKPNAQDVNFVTGMGEIFSLRGEHLPVYRLSNLLRKKTAWKDISDCIVVVVRSFGQPFSIAVDDILGQYQIVVKQLGQEHNGLKVFSGSTILGDGRPALILELSELVNKYKGFSGAHYAPEAAHKSTERRASL